MQQCSGGGPLRQGRYSLKQFVKVSCSLDSAGRAESLRRGGEQLQAATRGGAEPSQHRNSIIIVIVIVVVIIMNIFMLIVLLWMFFFSEVL